MFLKTLSIRGFKSFADRALLAFEPGITVVVGPNGSGKSNVVDAVAWVLGAQAPSSIRSGKMDDVIFAGTSKRPALGRAEVALTIDNTAGLLPVEFSEVTITRTLFRSGDSEYAINGVPCRLLDVQELLSDAGVGRQQHVIVSQGQIDAILNARPEDRRAIIEEAAGILKYRKRRERAERRLLATEGDLQRVNDLLREIRRQLRPLAKQAEAAERHDALQDELTSLQRYVAGQELVGLQLRLESVGAKRADAVRRSEEVTAELARLDAEVLTAEADLRRRGVSHVGDLLARAETTRERARGLAAVLQERRRGLERIMALRTDDDPVQAMDDELGEVAEATELIEAELADLEPQQAAAAAEEAAVAAEREALTSPTGDGPDPLVARAAEVRRQLAGLRAGLDRGNGELGRLRERLGALQRRSAAAEEESARHGAAADAADGAEDDLTRAANATRAGRERAEAEATAAEEALREAEADHRGATARVEALSQALDAARAAAGAARLGALDGVVGTLLDAVEVDPGWEAAFEAAVGDALDVVVVDGVDIARAGLRLLAGGDGGGALIPAALPASGASAVGRPFDERAVRRHVRGRDAAVDGLLDRLLVGAVRVDGSWEEALDSALADPAAVVVTPSGDRFGPNGWRVGAARAGVTGAMLDEARARAATAGERIGPARARLEAARASAKAARQDHEAANRALDEHASRARAAAVGRERAERSLAEVAGEAAQVGQQVQALEQRQVAEAERVTELEGQLPTLEAAERNEAARAEARAAAEADLDRRREIAGRRRMEVEVALAQRRQRLQLLGDRANDLRRRLEATRRSREEAAAERARATARLVVIDRLAERVAARLAEAEVVLEGLRETRRRLSDEARQLGQHLDGLRQQRAAAERRLTEARELAGRAELEAAEFNVRLEGLTERIRRELETEPEATLEAVCPELPDGVSAAARARDLERELRLLGPINPLAVEEHRSLQERHELIETQLADVRQSRSELHKVIRAIDEEIVGTFAAAFADVAGHFESLFSSLFPGGSGSLRLTTPDDLLNTGVEVEARPSGKNVRKLSLLSGGERSLTALGLLFAIFRSRPSPFYVMDEVEAALDDINLRRFLDLLEEFRAEAQLIVVSHQKRTMEVADCLYGVTMKPGESSRVVSEKLRSA
jgi:chromosome segregation protein